MDSGRMFTCITCRVAFATADVQRAHYKADWHRYNLKRKVAELPPVNAGEFQERVKIHRAGVAEREEEKDAHLFCKVCHKHFNSKNAFESHMRSKKHVDTETRIARSIQDELEKKKEKLVEKGLEEEGGEMDQDISKNALNLARSGVKSIEGLEAKNNSSGARRKTTSTQDSEMESQEGGSDDDDEWEEVEGAPIPVNHCLFCQVASGNLESNLQHMTNKHSFFIPSLEYLMDLEGLITYLGEKIGSDFTCLWCNEKGKMFYSLEAVQKHMDNKGHRKMLFEGDAVYEFADFYDFRKSYPDYEERQARGELDSDDEDMGLGQSEQLHTSDAGDELILPSGARIGHRAMMRYYRQNLPQERQVVARGGTVSRLMGHYKALGWTGTTGKMSQKTMIDLKYMKKVKAKHTLQLGVKANQLQPHFRSQNPI